MKIAIVLSTYNGEKYISEQLDSILNQTYQDFILIISDDCSTDGSATIMERYAEKDKRILLIKQPKNIGISKNKALDKKRLLPLHYLL